MTDHIAADLRAAMALGEDHEAPEGAGPGFLVYRLAQDFHALCCICGLTTAEREIAEIIQYERKPR